MYTLTLPHTACSFLTQYLSLYAIVKLYIKVIICGPFFLPTLPLFKTLSILIVESGLVFVFLIAKFLHHSLIVLNEAYFRVECLYQLDTIKLLYSSNSRNIFVWAYAQVLVTARSESTCYHFPHLEFNHWKSVLLHISGPVQFFRLKTPNMFLLVFYIRLENAQLHWKWWDTFFL